MTHLTKEERETLDQQVREKQDEDFYSSFLADEGQTTLDQWEGEEKRQATMQRVQKKVDEY